MLIDDHECAVVGQIYRTNAEFKRFYKEEREKKLGVICWVLKLNLPNNKAACAYSLPDTICYKELPKSANDAHIIAHEIMHLIRYQETDILEIIPTSSTYYELVGDLNSMLEDSIVEKILQNKYNFDLITSLWKTIDFNIKNLKKEDTDFVSRFKRGLNITNFMLLWGLITDQSALDEWYQHLEWIETKYPSSYKIAMEIKPVVDSIGLGTIDQQREIVLKLIDMYKLGDMISISESGSQVKTSAPKV